MFTCYQFANIAIVTFPRCPITIMEADAYHITTLNPALHIYISILYLCTSSPTNATGSPEMRDISGPHLSTSVEVLDVIIVEVEMGSDRIVQKLYYIPTTFSTPSYAPRHQL